MALFEIILNFLDSYFIPGVIIGTIFLGNVFILTISTLAAQGYYSFWKILFLVFIGVNIADVFWFYLARTNIVDFLHVSLKKRKETYQKFNKIRKKFYKKGRRSMILISISSKFLYGTETIAIFYFSRLRMGLVSFLGYNALGSFFWSLSIVTLGWLTGRGYGLAIKISENSQLIISLIVLFLFFLYITWGTITRKVLSN